MMQAQITGAVSGGLGAIMNQVPLPGKLTIIAVTKFSPVPVPVPLPPYTAMFNPENWQIQESVRHNTAQTPGSTGSEAGFNSIPARKLAFDLIVDGTGASGEKREVLADVLFLKSIVGFNGSEHRSNKFFVIWGTQLFQGVLETLSVKFTLFRPNGTPLRATISLSFVEDSDRTTSLLKMNLLSSDLTHVRDVKAGDRLDLLCHHIYRDSRHYLEVARANNLTTFRKIPVGAELIYPPTEK
ncbi:MAG: hypothetical protein IPM98_12225 [Lewinellaceae bacterium]|nr:hypothetical protein [Lewinellaceae bacterium]